MKGQCPTWTDGSHTWLECSTLSKVRSVGGKSGFGRGEVFSSWCFLHHPVWKACISSENPGFKKDENHQLPVNMDDLFGIFQQNLWLTTMLRKMTLWKWWVCVQTPTNLHSMPSRLRPFLWHLFSAGYLPSVKNPSSQLALLLVTPY